MPYSTRLDEAISLALDAFRDVHRKGTGVPYVTHLLMVCALVGEHGGDEDQMIAAILHDYLEDIDGLSIEALRVLFGDRPVDLVLALSDTTVRPKPPWLERKQAYLAHLPHEPPEVKLISAADKLHNCRSIIRDHKVIGDEIFDRFRPTKEQTLWYYRSCVKALGVGWDSPILDDLRRAVKVLHEVAGVAMDEA